MISRRSVLAALTSALPLTFMSKSSAATKILVCPSSSVKLNKTMAFQGKDASGNMFEIAITRTKLGLFAYNAACTHAGCGTSPAGTKLNCPCHGSVFDGVTGKVLNGPANRSLVKLKVKESKGNIYLVG